MEDISSPRCFEIEERLKKELDIPVFHDDQHGTAIVVLGGLINALKLVNKKIGDIRIVINGAGAAGMAISKLLTKAGARDIIICDKTGTIYKNRDSLNQVKKTISEETNPRNIKGKLADAITGADVFIGVSSAGILNSEMVKSMNNDAIILAMANPVPEIMPEEAKSAGARVVGTGRSDFSNQINNVLVFPGLFRGALDVRAKEINDEMKIAAAYAIADYIDEKDLNEEYIIPDVLDKKVAQAVAEAVKEAARKTGMARI